MFSKVTRLKQALAEREAEVSELTESMKEARDAITRLQSTDENALTWQVMSDLHLLSPLGTLSPAPTPNPYILNPYILNPFQTSKTP